MVLSQRNAESTSRFGRIDFIDDAQTKAWNMGMFRQLKIMKLMRVRIYMTALCRKCRTGLLESKH